jgi:hypothetical protein
MNQVAKTASARVLRRAQHRRGQFDILVMRLFERQLVNFGLKFNGFFGPDITMVGLTKCGNIVEIPEKDQLPNTYFPTHTRQLSARYVQNLRS